MDLSFKRAELTKVVSEINNNNVSEQNVMAKMSKSLGKFKFFFKF